MVNNLQVFVGIFLKLKFCQSEHTSDWTKNNKNITDLYYFNIVYIVIVNLTIVVKG